MKPYIAILIDSFWEAVGSRVLWVLLLGWTMILAALAPFGYISERSYQLTARDIQNRTRLLEQLAKAAKGQGALDVRAVVRSMDADFLRRVEQEASGEPGNRINESEIAKQLNLSLQDDTLYSAEAFPGAQRRTRLKPLIEQPSSELGSEELEELNRNLLKLAFPLELRSPRIEQLYIGYAGFKLGNALGVSRRQIKEFFEPVLLSIIIKLGLGVVAVFVGLIVTSSIIPDTFRTGSLHLLLSKPISRVWLFLSKFLGGCIFVFVNISFFLIGLYFIAGWRLDIWNVGLLGCIPLLMFVFVIFYSVSSLTGLIWGNPIISVVCCMIFWMFCFGLGFVYEFMLPAVEIRPQIGNIQVIDGRLVTVDQRGRVGVWNDQFSVWQPALESDARGEWRTYGPVYIAQKRTAVVKAFEMTPFGPNSDARKISLVRFSDSGQPPASSEVGESHNDEESAESGTPKDENDQAEDDQADQLSDKVSDQAEVGVKSIAAARREPVWNADLGPELPQQVFALLQMGDSVVAACRSGLYELDFDLLDAMQDAQGGIFGFKLPWVKSQAFKKISPPDFYFGESMTVSVLADGSGCVVYTSGELTVMRKEDDMLVSGDSVPVSQLVNTPANEDIAADETVLNSEDSRDLALVEMNENYCVLARVGMPILIFNPRFEVLHEVAIPDEFVVREISWVPGSDRLAIILQSGELFELDCATQKLSQVSLPFSGKCTSMRWMDKSHVYLASQPNQVRLVDMEAVRVDQAYLPTKTRLEYIFSGIIKPLYLVNPKPSALDNATSYLLTGSRTMNAQLVSGDLSSAQRELDIWQPIYSNLAFVLVILGISCVYVARKEY
ncbi:MAG: ABC transporter permease [Pirellulaceae bacterium]